MLKRILSLILVGVMALSLVACGGSSSSASSDSGTKQDASIDIENTESTKTLKKKKSKYRDSDFGDMFYYVEGNEIHYTAHEIPGKTHKYDLGGDSYTELINWERISTVGNSQEIEIAVFDEKILHKHCGRMFSMFRNLKSVKKIDYLITKNTSFMFSDGIGVPGCKNLIEIEGIENFDTSCVEEMTGMFRGCENIKSLDLNKWDTSNVKNFSDMFNGCTNLTTLKVDNWKFDSVEKTEDYNDIIGTLSTIGGIGTSGMFAFSGLEEIDLNKWDTRNFCNLYGMFNGCSNLKHVKIDKWNVENVLCAREMFSECENLEYLKIDKWNTSSFWDGDEMFLNCKNLRNLDLNNWKVDKLLMSDGMRKNGCYNMFKGCDSSVIPEWYPD